MKANENFKLSNNLLIPAIGFGTWQLPADKATEEVLISALRNGYSHIDTARGYGNENVVRAAVRKCGRAREEIFVTSKLPAEVKDPAAVVPSFEETLSELGLDYVDLYLIHAPWPWDRIGADYERENVLIWHELEKIYRSGRAKSIGVSNFSVANLENIMTSAEIVPHVNQIRYFIGDTEPDVVSYCREKNILVEAYSPLATGKLIRDERIKTIADKYGKSWAQICIKFCLQNDVLPLPKTADKDRAASNIDLDFEISDSDMQYLRNLDRGF